MSQINSKKLIINSSLIGLVFCYDQLLFPMLSFSGIPFKISYFLIFFWFLKIISNNSIFFENKIRLKNIFLFSRSIFIILFCVLIGEFCLLLFTNVNSYIPTLRNSLIYILVILSFFLGTFSFNFKLKWLFPLFYFSIILSFVFIFFSSYIPNFILNFYYPRCF